jgi:hypothetical protein
VYIYETTIWNYVIYILLIFQAKNPLPSEWNQLGNEGFTFFTFVADFFSTYYVSSYFNYATTDESNLLKSLLLCNASNA